MASHFECSMLKLRGGLHRGMTVTVYYDPSNPDGSNKELLDGIQEGKDGPFYGPEQPSWDSEIRNPRKSSERAPPRTSVDQVQTGFQDSKTSTERQG